MAYTADEVMVGEKEKGEIDSYISSLFNRLSEEDLF